MSQAQEKSGTASDRGKDMHSGAASTAFGASLDSSPSSASSSLSFPSSTLPPPRIRDDPYALAIYEATPLPAELVLLTLECKEVEEKDGSRYDGELNEEGKKHGEGVLRWKNGDWIEGKWKVFSTHAQLVFVNEIGIGCMRCLCVRN
jgi:hypothetical protein